MESSKLEQFSLTDMKAWEDLINIYKYLKGGYKEDEVRLFSVQQDMGSGHRLEHGRFPPEHQAALLCWAGDGHWHRLPRKLVESSWRSSKASWTCDWVSG